MVAKGMTVEIESSTPSTTLTTVQDSAASSMPEKVLSRFREIITTKSRSRSASIESTSLRRGSEAPLVPRRKSIVSVFCQDHAISQGGTLSPNDLDSEAFKNLRRSFRGANVLTNAAVKELMAKHENNDGDEDVVCSDQELSDGGFMGWNDEGEGEDEGTKFGLNNDTDDESAKEQTLKRSIQRYSGSLEGTLSDQTSREMVDLSQRKNRSCSTLFQASHLESELLKP
mmetsp:Transcript_4926/g.10344  ORF Transcript_4926/g.10344 Transcript_4926/m.10344 type:complete len:228 (-) Transcript_4926:512-1195(-)